MARDRVFSVLDAPRVPLQLQRSGIRVEHRVENGRELRRSDIVCTKPDEAAPGGALTGLSLILQRCRLAGAHQ